MAKQKAGSQAARPSFSLRLQPHEKSLLAEVVRYLTSLERSDALRQVESVLVMALLAQARLYDESCSDQERRRCCIEACDALEKHASMLRQLVGVARAMPQLGQPYERAAFSQMKVTEPPVGAQVKGSLLDEGDGEEEEAERRSPPPSRIGGRASAADVNSLFGD